MPKVVAYGPQKVSSNIGSGGGLSSPRAASSVNAGTVMTGPAQSIGGPGPMKQNVSADSFGVAPINPTAKGNAISNLGAGVAQLAQNVERFNLRVDTVAAEEALVKFEREQNSMFFDPEKGYFNTQGRNAYDQAKPFSKELEAVRQKYADDLKSEQARQMFDKASAVQITRANNDVMRHASTQFRAWESATINARVENSLENSVLYWNDPEKRAINLELGRQSVLDAGAIRGDSPETIAEAIQTFNSKFAAGTIEGALAQSASAAQVALAGNKELLEGPDIVKIQEKIDRQFKIEKTQQDSNAAVIAATSYVNDFGDMDNARTMITEQMQHDIEDPELYQATFRETMYQLNMKKQADSENTAAAYDRAFDYLAKPGGSIDRLIADDAATWDALTPALKRQLLRDTVVTTDATQWLEVTSLPIAEMAKVDPNAYVGVFARPQLEELRDLVRDAKEGGVEARLGQTVAAQTSQALESIIGTTRGKWNSTQKAQADAIYSTINSIVADASKTKGSKLTNDEYSAILRNFNREYIIDESTNRVVSGKQWLRNEAEMSVTDIPADDITVLTDYFRQNGIPVTAENLIMGYLDSTP